MPSPPRFHTLRVADIRRETEDAVSLAFTIPEALRPDYAFAAGQYLTFRRRFAGEEARRAYSICTAPEDGELRVAIKRVDEGLFSNWAHAELRTGDALDVMTPTGRFGQLPPARGPRNVALFAAGSGITPILSLARHLLAAEEQARLFLFYGNRSTAGMLFRDALEDLKDRYLGRLSIFHVLSQEQQDVPILNGRLDGEKVRALLRHLVPAALIDHALICGPAAMSETVEATLLALGLRPEQIHIERFTSIHDGKPRPAAPKPEGAAPRALATLIHDGRRETVPVADGETIIDAALRAGLDLPFSCKGGMCSTCRAKLVEGVAPMALNFSLEPWELAAGYILTCQARPASERVTIDFDQV